MSESRPSSGPPGLSRRRLLVGAGALSGAGLTGGLVVGGDRPGLGAPARPVRLPEPVAGLPSGQHRWNRTLATDRFGNRTAPRHQRLLVFDLIGSPRVEHAQRLEAVLRTLERRWAHGPAGLLTAVGWGPAWFAHLGIPSPVPLARALSDTEAPELEDHAAVVHLAADEPARLDAADRLLTRADTGLRLVSRRCGSTGRGLPRRAARRLELPAGVQPPADSPLMLGFASGRRRTQAHERDITTQDGRWPGSTTMHVSQIALTLTSWYRSLSDAERVTQMFGPGVTPAAVKRPGPGLTPPTEALAASARRHGTVGHAQAAATARRNGRPVILRRDFNGVLDGQPVTHFVAYQAAIEDFEATRRAMNATAAVGVNGVDAVVNNGINEWLSVHSRANFLVPPRSRRAFPGLPGWDAA